MITRADVVHWHSTTALPGGIDLALARKLRKRCVVEFHGSDIRQVTPDNPYLWQLGGEDPAMTASRNEAARRRQARFFGGDVHCVVSTPDLMQYVEASQFASVSLLGLAVAPPSLPVSTPPAPSGPMQILHSPSNEKIKGTQFVRQALTGLLDESVCVEILAEVPRDELLVRMGSCDIYLDQFIVGAYGVAAVEAMLLGKVVVCYLSDASRAALPTDCPVVPCTGDELASRIRELLNAANRRDALGNQSEEYARRQHDPAAVAARALDIYRC